MARMKLAQRFCRGMSVPHRESGASRFCNLQSRFNGDGGEGCPPEPFIVVSLPFFAVDDGDPLAATSRSSTDGQSCPQANVMFDTGTVEIVGRSGCVYARIVDAGQVVVTIRAWEEDCLVGHACLRAANADFACRVDRT